MVLTNEEIASKIAYLKKNNFMPNIDGESLNIQNAIQSFYFCSKTVTSEDNKPNDSDFWFRLTFCNYQVSDKFVREVNREYKRYKLLNIGKDET